MDIESSFIVKLIQTGDYDTVDKLQIKPSYFFGTNRRAFKFIVDFKTKYGKVPSLEEFSKKFKKFSFKTELEEPLAFYCDEVRRKTKHNTIAEALEEAREKMNDLDTDGAYKVLTGTVLKIEKDVILGDTKYLNEDTDKRKEAYLRKKLCGGITGIPTGIEAYDYITGGLGETDLVTFLGFTGIGKANPISTPILTPCGFIPMGDVKIGTKVIGEDGKPYDVTAIYPQGVIDVYELTFNDGSKARCSKEHLWKFKAKSNKHGTWEVNTLGNLMEKYKLKIGKAWNLSIPVNKSISFESKGDLIIDPYVLGVLLGDGGFTTDRITLTNPEKDIINKCQIKLKEWGKFTHHVGTNCQYCFKSNNSRKNKLYRKVKDLNLIKCSSKDKFIPKDYLYASIEDRKELLNGLMDTDGHVSKRGSFSFFTTSKQLKDDFIFLCRSLGYRCRVYIDHRPSKGNDCYKISILTDDVIVSSKKHDI
jgi:hypothetical protein